MALSALSREALIFILESEQFAENQVIYAATMNASELHADVPAQAQTVSASEPVYAFVTDYFVGEDVMYYGIIKDGEPESYRALISTDGKFCYFGDFKNGAPDTTIHDSDVYAILLQPTGVRYYGQLEDGYRTRGYILDADNREFKVTYDGA